MLVFFFAYFDKNLKNTTLDKPLKYLALGDSYTIGESVLPAQSFPLILQEKLKSESGIDKIETKIIAKTGWTTGELLNGIQRAKPKKEFDLVTLLIGVNNQYRGLDVEDYKTEFQKLLDLSISFAKGQKDQVIVVSIPDYGCTPFGKDQATKIHNELSQYNALNQDLSRISKVHWIDIFEISKRALTEPLLLAEDNLHPSGLMYKEWVDKILPTAKSILSNSKKQIDF